MLRSCLRSFSRAYGFGGSFVTLLYLYQRYRVTASPFFVFWDSATDQWTAQTKTSAERDKVRSNSACIRSWPLPVQLRSSRLEPPVSGRASNFHPRCAHKQTIVVMSSPPSKRAGAAPQPPQNPTNILDGSAAQEKEKVGFGSHWDQVRPHRVWWTQSACDYFDAFGRRLSCIWR